MAFDKLLSFTGGNNAGTGLASDSGGGFIETITSTGNGSAVLVGGDRLFQAELRIPNAPTGTSPTLDLKFQSSVDGASSWADIPGAAFAQQSAALTEANSPLRLPVRMPTGRPYARLVKTIGGSATPTFTGVSVIAQPVDASAF